MQWTIKIIGIVLVCIGAAFFLRPDLLKKSIGFVKKGYRINYAAILRIILAIVLFIGARECRKTAIIITIGVILLISGITVLVIGITRAREIVGWVEKKESISSWLLPIIMLLIGAVIIYAV